MSDHFLHRSHGRQGLLISAAWSSTFKIRRFWSATVKKKSNKVRINKGEGIKVKKGGGGLAIWLLLLRVENLEEGPELLQELKVAGHVGGQEALDNGGPEGAIVRPVEVPEEAVLGGQVEGHGARVILNNRDVIVHDGHLRAGVHLVEIVHSWVGNVMTEGANQDGEDVQLGHPLAGSHKLQEVIHDVKHINSVVEVVVRVVKVSPVNVDLAGGQERIRATAKQNKKGKGKGKRKRNMEWDGPLTMKSKNSSSEMARISIN